MHRRREGDLLGPTSRDEAPVERADRRVALDGDERAHPQRGAHAGAALDDASAAYDAALAVERGDPDQRGDLLAVQAAQLGQFGDQRRRQHRPDAGHALAEVVALAPGRTRADLPAQLAIQRVALLAQPGAAARPPAWRSPTVAGPGRRRGSGRPHRVTGAARVGQPRRNGPAGGRRGRRSWPAARSPWRSRAPGAG